MNRAELERHIAQRCSVEGDFPWSKYPEHEVFRHRGSGKWFALLMKVREDKLGCSVPAGQAPALLEILNVKCSPIMLGALLGQRGFYPAYHMNKDGWISIAIEQVEEETLRILLEQSYDLTAAKPRRVRRGKNG